MNASFIIHFLRQVVANNNRPWFQEHKDDYLEARAEFEQSIAPAILRIAEFDPSIAHVKVKDTTYRFYRDTRFSPDKSPYKNHFGAYIAAHGKKSYHGGYYIHMEPDNCLLACGSYYLPTNILTSCRNEIMVNIDEWRKCVDNNDFIKCFGHPGEGQWGGEKGFGLESLKTCPAGFPRDYEHIQYLKMKDYCAWKRVPESFFEADDWLDRMAMVFQTAKPMMDFVNAVIDDYE